MSSIHVDDVGTIFRATVTENGSPVDLTGATVFFDFEDPQAALHTVSATVLDQTTNVGQVEYIRIATDTLLQIAGNWRLQVRVNTAGGSTFHADIGQFDVAENVPLGACP